VDSVLGGALLGANELRAHEASVLRPAWDRLSANASGKAGVLNWDSAPASAWDQVASTSYADLVVKWANKVSRFLQETDPEGISEDPALTSLRRGFDFHIGKMSHLNRLGVSVPPVPSDLEAAWTGVKAAAAQGLDLGMSIAPWVVIGGVSLLALLLWRRY
jgi:hypothetical protein